jgi:hypothetical protein
MKKTVGAAPSGRAFAGVFGSQQLLGSAFVLSLVTAMVVHLTSYSRLWHHTDLRAVCSVF